MIIFVIYTLRAAISNFVVEIYNIFKIRYKKLKYNLTFNFNFNEFTH